MYNELVDKIAPLRKRNSKYKEIVEKEVTKIRHELAYHLFKEDIKANKNKWSWDLIISIHERLERKYHINYGPLVLKATDLDDLERRMINMEKFISASEEARDSFWYKRRY